MTQPTTFSCELHYRPIRWWSSINWQEFFWYKDFLLLLIWRNISIRYRQTVIGVAWVVLQPIVNLVVFTLVFNRMAGIQSSYGLPYPIFLMTGLLFWQYFSTALTFASNALIDNPELVNKVYVPRYMLPLAVVVSVGIDFCVGTGLLLIMLVCWGTSFSITGLLILPVLFLCVMLAVFGLGLILSSINAQFRDIRFVVPFFLQVLFYLTPVFYPIEILNNHLLLKQVLLVVNPLTGMITLARSCIAGTGFDAGLLGISMGVSIGIFVVAWFFFRRREMILADII
ncbi:MAG: ABC transporter permease [Candidatus Omnitrophota bacterium]